MCWAARQAAWSRGCAHCHADAGIPYICAHSQGDGYPYGYPGATDQHTCGHGDAYADVYTHNRACTAAADSDSDAWTGGSFRV